jgi:hypothetical protein
MCKHVDVFFELKLQFGSGGHSQVSERMVRSGKPICHLVIGPTTEQKKKMNKLPSDTYIFLVKDFSFPEGFVCDEFRPESFLPAETYCEGPGPIDFLSMVRFMKEFDDLIFRQDSGFTRRIVCYGGPTRRSFTNTVFLLGAYLILKLDCKASTAGYHFRGIDPSAFELFTDPSASQSNFTLSVADCWGAIERSKGCGWIEFPRPNRPYRWGLIESDAYAHYNDPLNADLHEIVPGRLFALRAPSRLDGRSFVDKYIFAYVPNCFLARYLYSLPTTWTSLTSLHCIQIRRQGALPKARVHRRLPPRGVRLPQHQDRHHRRQ